MGINSFGNLEEAALNLGATRFEVIRFITLPFLRPALSGSAAVAFLMSFENFNTILFLVGAETTLPINLYLQVRDGSTPIINAVFVNCLHLDYCRYKLTAHSTGKFGLRSSEPYLSLFS